MKQLLTFIIGNEVPANICLLSPPLWGRGGEGGISHDQDLWFTPLPDPPPQGGRKQESPIGFAVAMKFCDKAVA